MIPIRPCGSQGFKCTAQGLGCMGMSTFYGEFTSKEAKASSLKVLERSIKFDGMMLDTSDAYGPHTNEELIGRHPSLIPLTIPFTSGSAISGSREQIRIATKCGTIIEPQGRRYDCSPEYVKKSCQGKSPPTIMQKVDEIAV